MHSIVVAVALPPPVHGQSTVNLALLEGLRKIQDVSLDVVDISPRQNKKNTKYHVNRIRAVARASLLLINHTLSRKKGSAYFVFESGYGVFYNAVLIALARLARKKIYLHHHTAFHSLSHSISFEWVSRLSGRGSVHVVLSDDMRYDIASKYTYAKNVVTVSNAVFTANNACMNSVRSSFSRGTLGYISNLCVEKGALTVFQTFKTCKKIGIASRLIVAGPVGDKETEVALGLLIKEYGADVEYRGAVYSGEKERFYSDIDVELFPTRYKYEAQPLVVIEALQRAIPVLTTTKGYISELVAGEGVFPDDPSLFQDAVVKRLSQWIESPFLYQEASDVARARFLELKRQSIIQFDELISKLSRESCALD